MIISYITARFIGTAVKIRFPIHSSQPQSSLWQVLAVKAGIQKYPPKYHTGGISFYCIGASCLSGQFAPKGKNGKMF